MQNPTQAQTLDLFIPTASVTVQGTPNSQISYKVEKGKDSVVTFKSEKNKSELFVKSKANLKKPLEVLVPKKHALHLEIGTGDVSLSSIETDLEGKVDSGSITMSDITGSLYLFTKEGDVTIRNGEASGSVGSGEGNVLIEDVHGPLQGYSQKGTVMRKFTQTYANRYNETLEVNLEKSDLEVATVLTKGANMHIEQGNLSIGRVNGSLQTNSGIGHIAIASLNSNLMATTAKGDITVNVSGLHAKQYIVLTTKEGNITITLPSSYSGQVYIEQVATDANKANYRLVSDFNLGAITKEALQDEQGNLFAYQTLVNQNLGSGNARIFLQVSNGNITLKKSNP